MHKPPITVIVLSVLLILTGAMGILYHLSDFKGASPFQFDVLGVAFIRFLAIVAGGFMLRGHNWARWLAIAWIAFHVVISALNSMSQMAMHALILVAFALLLFRRPASDYFRTQQSL